MVFSAVAPTCGRPPATPWSSWSQVRGCRPPFPPPSSQVPAGRGRRAGRRRRQGKPRALQSVSVSRCCSNKSAQTLGLKQTPQTYKLTVLEVRAQSRSHWGETRLGRAGSFRRPQAEPVPAPFPAARGTHIPWPAVPSSVLKAGSRASSNLCL